MIKKAIIAAAGFGTRFLPATKVLPKEILPIVDKPIIHYLVEELASSGIREIILVTRGRGQVIRDYFSRSPELEYQLKYQRKFRELEKIRQISKLAHLIFLEQKLHLPYGNAAPILVAKDLVKSEPFVYIYGDDLVLSKTPGTRQLIKIWQKNKKAAAVLGVQKMSRCVLGRYGIIKLKRGTKNQVAGIVEKPTPAQAPSRLAVFGRFILTSPMIQIIEELPVGKRGELWLSDGLNRLAQKNLVLACPLRGQWFTTGDPLNFLKASIEFALARSDYRKEFLNRLKEIRTDAVGVIV